MRLWKFYRGSWRLHLQVCRLLYSVSAFLKVVGSIDGVVKTRNDNNEGGAWTSVASRSKKNSESKEFNTGIFVRWQHCSRWRRRCLNMIRRLMKCQPLKLFKQSRRKERKMRTCFILAFPITEDVVSIKIILQHVDHSPPTSDSFLDLDHREYRAFS